MFFGLIANCVNNRDLGIKTSHRVGDGLDIAVAITILTLAILRVIPVTTNWSYAFIGASSLFLIQTVLSMLIQCNHERNGNVPEDTSGETNAVVKTSVIRRGV